MGEQCHLGYIQPVFLQCLYLGKNFSWSSLHYHISTIHYINLVGMDHFFHIMGNQDNGYIFFFIELGNGFQYFFPAIRVKHCSWLVQYNTAWTHRHNTCDGNSLFLASGKLVRRLITVSGHSCLFQTVIHTLPDFVCRYSHILRTKAYILFHNRTNDLVVRILKNHPRFLADFPQLRLLGCVHIIHPHGSL